MLSFKEVAKGAIELAHGMICMKSLYKLTIMPANHQYNAQISNGNSDCCT